MNNYDFNSIEEQEEHFELVQDSFLKRDKILNKPKGEYKMKKFDDKEVLDRMGIIDNEVLEIVDITHNKAKEPPSFNQEEWLRKQIKENRWVKADIAEELLEALIDLVFAYEQGNDKLFIWKIKTSKDLIQRASGKEIMNEADRWLSLCKNSIQLK